MNCPHCQHEIDLAQKQKPPIGVMPRKEWDRRRAADIQAAKIRYRQANKPIPDEWFEEMEEIRDRYGLPTDVEGWEANWPTVVARRAK